MFSERIYISDGPAGDPVNDPERTLEYASGLKYGSIWPKGHATAGFKVRRDIAAQWAIKGAYDCVIRDGLRIVYQGRLAGLQKAIQSTDEFIDLRADGWICALKDRTMRKRWVDNAAVTRFKPESQDTILQNEFDVTKNNDYCKVSMGFSGTVRTNTDEYSEQYFMPKNTKITRVIFDWALRSGEGVGLEWYNDDQAATEGAIGDDSGALQTGTVDDPLAQGDTESLTWNFYTSANDTYDHNDWVRMYNLFIYGKMDSFGAPNYYADEITQDILEIIASDAISADYDGLTSPSLALIPFMTLNDAFETGDSIIQRSLGFGDGSDNTFGFCVWDKFGTSDGLPKAFIEQRSVADYEYVVSLAEISDFRDEADLDAVKNWIVVKHVDSDDWTVYITPDDDATLKDTSSIASYHQRNHTVDAGNCDTATATEYGTRFLEYHKEPPHQMSFGVTGWIRKKGGVQAPVNQVRAGDRILVEDWDDGVICFIRSAQYDAESKVMRLERDLPPNTLETWLARRDLAE